MIRVVLESIRVVRLPGHSKARVEDGERGKGLVVLDEVWLGVIVLRVGNISHPSHRQVKTPGHTLPPAMENGIDDIGCIYMRLPDVELSQETPISLTWLRLAGIYRSDKGHPEEGGSWISVVRCTSQRRDSSSRRYPQQGDDPFRSDIQSSKMDAIARFRSSVEFLGSIRNSVTSREVSKCKCIESTFPPC